MRLIILNNCFKHLFSSRMWFPFPGRAINTSLYARRTHPAVHKWTGIRITYLVCSILFSSFVFAGDDGIPINNTSELQMWCKEKAAEYFYSKDSTPFNWSASEWIKGNVLNVKGSWSVNSSKQIVNCRILKGAAKKYVIIKMPSQSRFSVRFANEAPINNAREFLDWCKNKSAQRFIEANQSPYNWTASQWQEGNYLNIKGNWKVKDSTQVIHCRIRKGVAEKYARIEITK